MKKWILPILFMIGFLWLWQTLSAQSWFPPNYILPTPLQIFNAYFEFQLEIKKAALETSTSTLVGFLLSVFLGTSLALILSLSNTLRTALWPFVTFFQTVPLVAIAPLLVIWFGFGAPTVRASAFIVSFFPVVASTLVGLENTRPSYLDLFRLYGANRWKILFKLRLPSSLPFIFSGWRIAAGLAVIGAIVGEFIGGGGLGSLVDSGRTQQRIDLVFACVIIASVLASVFMFLLEVVRSKLVDRWPSIEK
jgi:NitT/TauT family transport system permease protein